MNRRRTNKKSRSGRNGIQQTDRAIAQSTQAVGKSQMTVPSKDFVRQVPSWHLTQSPPRNFRSNICWIEGKQQVVQVISNSVPTENNYAFRLSDLADIVGIAAYFDQYCLYSVTVNITPSFEGAGSTLYSFGSLATAIDYDNDTTLGSLNKVLSYGTSSLFELGSNNSIQRYIKPCVAPALYNSGAAFSGYAVDRMWIDSASTAVPHYGLRTFYVSNTVSGFSCAVDINYVFGLRNND